MKKSKTTIIFIATLIVSVFFLSVFIFSLNIIKNKNKQISAIYKVLEEKKEFQSKSKLIQKNELYIIESSQLINSYFVDPENIDLFIDFIENLGSREGVNLTVKNVEVSKTNKKIISISFFMGGSFSNVFRMVQKIEYAPYKIQVKSFYLNKTILSEQEKKNPDKIKKYFPWQANIVIDVISAN